MKTDYKPEEIAQIKVLLDDAFLVRKDAEKLKEDLFGIESLMNNVLINNKHQRIAMARLRAATDNVAQCIEEIGAFRDWMKIACDLPAGK